MTLPTKEELDRLAAMLDGYGSSMNQLHRDISDDFKAAAGVCRRALELEKEVERLRAATAWRPIATAPKDCVEKLLWFPWSGPGEGTVFIGIWSVDGTGTRGFAWRDPTLLELLGEPTRWCPLPPAPEDGGEGRG